MNRIGIALLASTIALMLQQQATASVTLYDQYAAWGAAAGPFTTVTFNEVPHPTLLSNQYQDLGILFTSADPDVAGSYPNASDGAAVNGFQIIEVTFAAPINAFAWLHPGATRIRLFSGDTLVYQSTYLGGSGWGWFTGVHSSVAFDRIQLNDFDTGFGNPVYVDNIYFSTIPGPAGLALIGFAGLIRGSRRRA